jgi:hypothetical protein
MDPTIREQWPEQHKWLCEKLEAFKRVFAPRVRAFDTSRSKVEESVELKNIEDNPGLPGA